MQLHGAWWSHLKHAQSTLAAFDSLRASYQQFLFTHDFRLPNCWPFFHLLEQITLAILSSTSAGPWRPRQCFYSGSTPWVPSHISSTFTRWTIINILFGQDFLLIPGFLLLDHPHVEKLHVCGPNRLVLGSGLRHVKHPFPSPNSACCLQVILFSFWAPPQFLLR